MKTLLLLRHAKSSWKQPDLADHDRPLNSRGQRDAPRMGRLLLDEGLTPDVIITSTATRARSTANKAAAACEYEAEIVESEDLYHASAAAHLDVLRELDDGIDSAMLVGHNPGLEALLELLTGADDALPTAALAQISLPIDKWSELCEETQGELVALWRPKELE